MSAGTSPEGPQEARWRAWSAGCLERLLPLPVGERIQKMRMPAFANLTPADQAALWASIEQSGPVSEVATLTAEAVAELSPQEQETLARRAIRQLKTLPVPEPGQPTMPQRAYRDPDPIEPATHTVRFSVSDQSPRGLTVWLLQLTSVWATAVMIVGVALISRFAAGG